MFGGRSAEHEVSLLSARNVVEAVDRDRFDVLPVAIDRAGNWLDPEASARLLAGNAPQPEAAPAAGLAGLAGLDPARLAGADVVFPVLHGPFGEDGTVQGVLRLAGLPFVGAGVLGSAVAMDKDVMKRLLREAGLPVARFVVLRAGRAVDFAAVVARLGLPVFVKPANLGSSVGVSRATDAASFAAAVEEAFRFDSKVLVEEEIRGREIECAVLGDAEPEASVLGEIVPLRGFYSYEAKYLDADGARLVVPAPLPQADAAAMRRMALDVFRTLDGIGMGRVDFFHTGPGGILVNELNTIPGFTAISMYPRLWQASGLSYRDLVSRLLDLALARHARDSRLAVARA